MCITVNNIEHISKHLEPLSADLPLPENNKVGTQCATHCITYKMRWLSPVKKSILHTSDRFRML